MKLAPSAWRRQPWANGRGVTHELARWPAGAADYIARIAVAELRERAAFSSFAGYARWLAPLDGEVELVVDGVAHVLAPGRALAFDGAAIASGGPTGAPTLDLNVMVKAGLPWQARIVAEACALAAHSTRVVFVIAGAARANGEELAAHDAFVTAAALELAVAPGSLVAVVELPVGHDADVVSAP